MEKKLKNILKKYLFCWPFIVFTFLVVFFTRKFITQPGLILYSEFLESTNYYLLLKDFLTGWGSYISFGHSNIGLTTSYGLNPVFWILPPGYFMPLLTLLSILQLIFGDSTGKIFIILSIFVPFVGMYLAGLYWFSSYTKKKSELQAYSFIAAIIYSVSSIMGEKIIAAHLKYSFGHGIFPLLIVSTIQAVENKKKRTFYIVANGLLIGMLIWLMPHLLTLYLLISGLYFLIIYRDKKKILSLCCKLVFVRLLLVFF